MRADGHRWAWQAGPQCLAGRTWAANAKALAARYAGLHHEHEEIESVR